jgi:hypothetical protein
MQKTAQDIAVQVLEKLAVSRWREAIYSGELNTPEAEKLKSYMNVNPHRYADRLVEGTKNRLAERGNRIIGPRQLPTRIKDLPYKALSMYRGTITNPITGNIFIHPGDARAIAELGDIPQDAKSLRKQINSLILSHEGMESVAARGLDANSLLKKQYLRWKPEDTLSEFAPHIRRGIGYVEGVRQGLLKPGTPNRTLQSLANFPSRQHSFTTGSHVDPSIVLNEIRQSRMLSPPVREAFNDLRLHLTGEVADANTLAPKSGIPDSPLIRKKDIPSLSKRMRALSNTHAQGHITALDNAMYKTFEPSSKIRGMATSVFNKLKGFIR